MKEISSGKNTDTLATEYQALVKHFTNFKVGLNIF